jgi:signal transduction histidine kinase
VRVAQRLYVAVLPAVLGVVLVAALGYWGQYHHTVPQAFVVIAAVTAVASLVMTWRNTRYVARRIERLAEGRRRAGGGAAGDKGDELETIERVVDTLSSEVTVVREASVERERAAAQRVSEYASLLAETSASVARRLDEVRLPLHILIENRFGELNDNQEEMLAAARIAAEDAESDVRRLREIAQIDQGALALRRDSVKLGDVIASILPTLRSRAEREGVRLEVDLPPGLPRFPADTVRLREALSLLIEQRIANTTRGEAIRLTVERAQGETRIALTHPPIQAIGSEESLARRLIEAHGGRIETSGGSTRILLPA